MIFSESVWVQDCEATLAKFFGRKYCIWTGNGTSALSLSYSLSSTNRPKILLPALMCMHPMFAATYADRTPVFCDVLEESGTIDPDLVEDMLSKDENIGAVLAVHLFGNAAQMSRLKATCTAHQVLLIEDLAQAFGGRFADGSLFGSSGDVSVASFGYSKILDTGDGGAILTDDPSVADTLRNLESEIPVRLEDAPSFASAYKVLYYQIVSLGAQDARFFELFDLFPELFRSLFHYRATAAAALVVSNRLSALDLEIQNRKLIADLYASELAELPGVKLFPGFSGVPWRFNFRVDALARPELMRRIRQEGFDVSSWYPILTDWNPSGRSQGSHLFPIANNLSREIVNLWVDQSYDECRATALVKFIKIALSELRGS